MLLHLALALYIEHTQYMQLHMHNLGGPPPQKKTKQPQTKQKTKKQTKTKQKNNNKQTNNKQKKNKTPRYVVTKLKKKCKCINEKRRNPDNAWVIFLDMLQHCRR